MSGTRPRSGNAQGGAARPPKGPERIGGLVERFLEGSGVAEQVKRQSVLEEWSERVGEAIAAVTHARAISEGTLFVEVRSSPWLMELEMMKGDILKRVNVGRDDAAIERIVFVLGEQR